MFNNQTGRRGYQRCHRKYSIVQSKECNFYFFLNWILLLSLFWSVHSLSEIQVQAGSQAVKCRKSLSRSTQVDRKQTPQNKKISALHLPGKDWESSLWIRNWVCLRVCMNSDAFTHKTTSSSSSLKQKRTMPSWVFFFLSFSSVICFFKCWHCIKSFCLFVFHLGTVIWRNVAATPWNHVTCVTFYVCL